MSRLDHIAEEVAVLMPMIARRILIGFFQSVNLTQTQIFTIMALEEEAPVQLNRLKQKLNISAPTVTGIIDRLEKSGHVRRTPGREDRRVVNVDLTPKGKEVAKKLRTTIKTKWKSLLTKLPERDQENYVALLRKIQRTMQ